VYIALAYRGRPRGGRQPREKKGKPKPMPLPDGKCNSLCLLFRCLNRSLVTVRRVVHGRVQHIAMCRWIGDQCIGGTCQYASCAAKALLPDGTCLYAKEGRAPREEEAEREIEKELSREEREMSRIERMMRRRGYAIDEDMF